MPHFCVLFQKSIIASNWGSKRFRLPYNTQSYSSITPASHGCAWTWYLSDIGAKWPGTYHFGGNLSISRLKTWKLAYKSLVLSSFSFQYLGLLVFQRNQGPASSCQTIWRNLMRIWVHQLGRAQIHRLWNTWRFQFELLMDFPC